MIEDEIGICDFLASGLEEEGFEVVVQNKGKGGLEYALNETIDLLLLDWLLPEINGLDICKVVRKSKPNIPIIFLTSKVTYQDTIEGLKAGAIDYVKKPFNFEELLQRIKNHLSLRMNEVQILGNIELNNSNREVYVNKEFVHLTQKEFDLLKYFIDNKNAICTRNKIIEEVWNIGFDYDTSIIDVYINSLRKKLKMNKDSNYIQTIRGIGYIAKD
ncbi:response regulator transcription factor [Bacteroides sp.]|uniref:response regulator transcription factor n=1 Tax=Bacteroides sp. TaxID=29523 RepID=UPI00262C084E|nr:response regulator transcription factor [Bacteroides sp.]MDD3038022.1 response regulator transcription factor [Bacteroides sp.]